MGYGVPHRHDAGFGHGKSGRSMERASADLHGWIRVKMGEDLSRIGWHQFGVRWQEIELIAAIPNSSAQVEAKSCSDAEFDNRRRVFDEMRRDPPPHQAAQGGFEVF